jgi:hypothetical protein
MLRPLHLASHAGSVASSTSRQIIFSTEGSLGKPDRKLFFSMGLPPPGQMEELRGILVRACRGRRVRLLASGAEHSAPRPSKTAEGTEGRRAEEPAPETALFPVHLSMC